MKQSERMTARYSGGRHRRNAGQRGQSMIEVAIFLSALMVLISGIIQVGVAVNAYLNVINAAREGARSDVRTIPDVTNCSDASAANALAVSISDVAQATAQTTLNMTPANSTIVVTRARAYNLTGTTIINCYTTYTESTLGASASRFTLLELQARLNQPSQLTTGFTEFVVVEVFYAYRFFLAPVDIPMYSYTIMPVLGR